MLAKNNLNPPNDLFYNNIPVVPIFSNFFDDFGGIRLMQMPKIFLDVGTEPSIEENDCYDRTNPELDEALKNITKKTKNMTEKEKILFKLKSIDEKEVDRKSYDLLCENEILGRLNLFFEKKSEILEKNWKKFEKYKVLEEQKEDKFFVDYPYEEVFSLFKDCIDTAEKAYGEIFDTLKQNGWKEIDITNISFSSLRLKTYAKSKLTDEQIQELDKVTQLVFRKFYNENRLLENNLLIYPLNNQVYG